MSLLPAKPELSFAKMEGEPFCFLDTEECPDDWSTEFGNDHPITLEVGFGLGNFLIAMAVKEPENNFIGMDFYFPPKAIRNLLDRIKKLQLKNVRLVHGDVKQEMPTIFQDAGLHTVFINFPDPWPQKRHKKRRLIHPKFVKGVAQKLAPEGCLRLSTDSPFYAEEMLEYLNAEPLLQNKNPEIGVLHNRGDLPKSKYEKGFLYSGDPVHYLEYIRLPVAGESPHQEKEDLKEPERGPQTSDEILIKKFKKAEADAKDACDLKRVADDLADAGDSQWARKVFVKAEAQAEDCLDLNWLAASLCEKLGDREWAREVYKKAEARAEDSLDFNWLAYSLCENLGDKKWAEKLYQQSETRTTNVRELCDLADSVLGQLDNKPWAMEIFRKAEAAAKDSSDFFELADNLCEVSGDRAWARNVYQKAEVAANGCSDLHSLAESLCRKLGDRPSAEIIYQQAGGRAQNSSELCALADSLCQHLDDKEWARKLYQRAEGLAEESDEFRDLAISLCNYLGDRVWAGKIFREAEARASAFYDLRWLAESLCQQLGDKDWARKIYQLAEGQAKDPSDFLRLTLSKRENLEEE